ncbi:MAG: hypothetical protein A3G41_05685 [Elusimicrobia bacterium RIFCSPLOWO2_12_FULL_59_9]|nr:MAG: hypothetical protein A3G41_05685 [Elusimicrobia bacterium RIFCSPLOWO2_12_FULL_59_9]
MNPIAERDVNSEGPGLKNWAQAFDTLWRQPKSRLRLARVLASFLRRHYFRSPYPPMILWEPKTLHEVQEAWTDLAEKRRAQGNGDPVGLYIHVPFCETKCLFCNCMSVTNTRQESHDLYLDCLEKEVALLAFPRSMPIDTVYFGGGTPTLLSPARLRRLIRMLDQHFDLTGCHEKTIELSPFSISEETVRILRDWGVTRVTVGIQTMDQELLERFMRPQTPESVTRLYHWLRTYGIPQIHFDLLAGLPGQSMESFRESLDFCVRLRPDSMSVYPFAYINKTPYRLAGGKYGASDVACREDMMRVAREVLGGLYPVDGSFSVQNENSGQRVDRDHKNGSIVGLGYSARSYARDRLSYTKVNDFGRYLRALQAGEYPELRGWNLSPREGMRAYVVDRLEMAGQISMGEFLRLYGRELRDVFSEEIHLAIGHGLLKEGNGILQIPEDPQNHETYALTCGKLFFSREVLLSAWKLFLKERL